jgi:hypothetical protein
MSDLRLGECLRKQNRDFSFQSFLELVRICLFLINELFYTYLNDLMGSPVDYEVGFDVSCF